MFYGFGTLICVPASKAQPVMDGLTWPSRKLNNKKKLMELLSEAGFSSVRSCS